MYFCNLSKDLKSQNTSNQLTSSVEVTQSMSKACVQSTPPSKEGLKYALSKMRVCFEEPLWMVNEMSWACESLPGIGAAWSLLMTKDKVCVAAPYLNCSISSAGSCLKLPSTAVKWLKTNTVLSENVPIWKLLEYLIFCVPQLNRRQSACHCYSKLVGSKAKIWLVSSCFIIGPTSMGQTWTLLTKEDRLFYLEAWGLEARTSSLSNQIRHQV